MNGCLNEMPFRRQSREDNCLNETTNGSDMIATNSSPEPTDCEPINGSEVVYRRPEAAADEVSESCALSRTYSRSTSRQKSYVCGGGGLSRPSLISHHMPFAAESGDFDRVDALPDHMTFTILDVFAILFSIGSFLFDIGTDIAVAAFHCLNQDYWYFGLTLAFVMLPTLVMTGISLRWYVVDSREVGSPPTSNCQWIMRIIFLLLQLGPILRYFDSLMYGLKFRQKNNSKETQKKYFQYMVYEDTDAAMLRLFECFMEAAPQLVLQLYILARGNPHSSDDWTVVAQIVAVLASLVSLSWSLVSYHRALRLSLPDKANMTWPGIAIQFIWRFFSIASRVLALALFASEFRFYISIVCCIHWLIMFLWIVSMRTQFCDNKCEELGYNAVLGVMFIFCYFNPVDRPTRKRYTVYYVFIFFENIILMTFWYTHCDDSKWYKTIAMYGHFASFFVGLCVMSVYYLRFHPSRNVVCCRGGDDCDNSSSASEQSKQNQLKHKLHTTNGLWTTQGRLLHPRPAIPTSISETKLHKIANSCIKDNTSKELHKGVVV